MPASSWRRLQRETTKVSCRLDDYLGCDCGVKAEIENCSYQGWLLSK